MNTVYFLVYEESVIVLYYIIKKTVHIEINNNLYVGCVVNYFQTFVSKYPLIHRTITGLANKMWCY